MGEHTAARPEVLRQFGGKSVLCQGALRQLVQHVVFGQAREFKSLALNQRIEK